MSLDTAPSLDAVGESVSPRRRAMTKLFSATPFYLAGVLLLMAIAFSVLRPDAFPTPANFRNILTDVSVLLVMAVGMTYVMVAGGFDLSIGSVLVFSGVMAAKTMGAVGGEGWSPVFAGLVVALISGIVWGLFNGFCVTRLRVPALITTLGTTGAALGIARLITDGNDVRTVPLALIKFSVDEWLGLPALVWISAVVTIAGGLHLAYTRFGRHTYIVGSNAEAARRAGINVDRHLVRLYALSGLLAGLAGMMSLTRFSTTTIAGHAQDSLQVITGVVLGGVSLFGGVGTIVGTTVGMFISSVLNNGLIVVDVKPFWQEVAIGFILIIAVYIDQRRRNRRDRG
ncbi:ABC transporter permease [Cryptosporangium phraense]|uniref:ABC transporter permease n=1 Tax=Cryptosporangium phraense TaxID=2593070 RepID=A0A545AVE7_9ACTN|nr:ABC transporter permease [Cryptosporangium phraense]TQS45293.1 ABC transporter permease [Cryptosporangium phraense]